MMLDTLVSVHSTHHISASVHTYVCIYSTNYFAHVNMCTYIDFELHQNFWYLFSYQRQYHHCSGIKVDQTVFCRCAHYTVKLSCIFCKWHLLYIYICALTHTRYSHVYIHTCICTHAYAHAHTHTYTHTHTHTHTNKHSIHKHTQIHMYTPLVFDQSTAQFAH